MATKLEDWMDLNVFWHDAFHNDMVRKRKNLLIVRYSRVSTKLDL